MNNHQGSNERRVFLESLIAEMERCMDEMRRVMDNLLSEVARLRAENERLKDALRLRYPRNQDNSSSSDEV